MSADRKQAAIDAAEAALRNYLGPWLTHEVYGCTLGSQLAQAARLALRDAEAALAAKAAEPTPAPTGRTGSSWDRGWAARSHPGALASPPPDLAERAGTMTTDPLTIACPHCDEPPGNRCGTINAYSRKPHVARVKLARALAAHADPALDAFFPLRNQCMICGVRGMPQRHRMVDAIAGHLEAGECETDVAEEMGVSLDAVMAVTAWANRWPGAWR